MTLYWPCAEYDNGRWPEPQHLFTYDSCLTKKKALECIKAWRDIHHYNLTKAWIDTFDGYTTLRENIDLDTLSEALEGV